MHDHLLNNCRFDLIDTNFIDRKKLELILLSYNQGWGQNKSRKTISNIGLENAKYFFVIESVIWQSTMPYSPYDYLPCLNVQEILLNY